MLGLYAKRRAHLSSNMNSQIIYATFAVKIPKFTEPILGWSLLNDVYVRCTVKV